MASNVVSDNFETSGGGVPQLGGTGATTCKAWVNFNGTGTVAINDSYNVSSITDLAVGKYTINLTTAMTNTNYSVSVGGGQVSTQIENRTLSVYSDTKTTTAFTLRALSTSSTAYDNDGNMAQVFGD